MISKTDPGHDALLQGLQRQDPQVLTRFYSELHRRTRHYVRKHYGAFALDVLDDCFPKAFHVLLQKVQSDAYRHDNLEAFAFGIVKYTFLEARRRAAAKEQLCDPAELPEPGPSAASYFSTGDELFDHLGCDRHLLWYERLSFREQQILDLRLQGYPHEEIAAAVGLSCGSVRNAYSRLIEQARGIADEAGDPYGGVDG